MDDLRAALERHQPSDNEFCRWCVGLWPCDASRALAALAAAESRVAALRSLVDQQAEDEGLWFVALTAPEAYLQQELRKLCAAIESDLLAEALPAAQEAVWPDWLREDAKEIEAIVYAVEARCEAADGPVTPHTLSEMTEAELRRLWQAAHKIAEAAK